MSEEQAEYDTDGGQQTAVVQGKPIRCPECREVVGHVLRRSGIRTLRVEAGGMAIETAFEADVWCACGGLLHWYAGQEALDELIKKMQGV